MHPADEFETFWRLGQDGRSVEEVAQCFGTSPITVRRRLRLADVHPDLLVLYRQDGITMEQLMALALSDDQDEQLRAWNALPEWQCSAHALRAMLVSDEVNAFTDALAKFIGIDAYEAGAETSPEMTVELGGSAPSSGRRGRCEWGLLRIHLTIGVHFASAASNDLGGERPLLGVQCADPATGIDLLWYM